MITESLALYLRVSLSGYGVLAVTSVFWFPATFSEMLQLPAKKVVKGALLFETE